MSFERIHLLLSVQNCILLVYYSDAHAWQFRIINGGNAVFGERKLYYSAEAAEQAGREWLKTEG